LTVHPEPLPGGRIAEIARNRRLFRIAVLAATILSIVAINELSQGNEGGEALRKVSSIIFLVLTALEAYLTLTLLAVESSEGALILVYVQHVLDVFPQALHPATKSAPSTEQRSSP
jgi:hypothetical protein